VISCRCQSRALGLVVDECGWFVLVGSVVLPGLVLSRCALPLCWDLFFGNGFCLVLPKLARALSRIRDLSRLASVVAVVAVGLEFGCKKLS
jgi:hypothetical protein